MITTASSTSSVVPVTDVTFDAVVLESDVPVLVDFWAAWCGPCRMMDPLLEQLATRRDDLLVVSLDIEANPGMTARYGVLSVPTLLVFHHGEPVLSLVGSRPLRRLEQELSAVL